MPFTREEQKIIRAEHERFRRENPEAGAFVDWVRSSMGGGQEPTWPLDAPQDRSPDSAKWPVHQPSPAERERASREAEFRENLRRAGPYEGVRIPEGLSQKAAQKIASEVQEGRKDDGGKAPYDLLAPEFLAGTAEILAFGAAKYAPRNWEKGMAWSRAFAAMMRHMWAWWAGEQLDAETGKSHLWHASCCLMFLVAYEQRKSGTDDRPNSA